jgi:hypothetical protein
MSDANPQRQVRSIDSNHTAYHYVMYHNYAPDEFSEQGQITQFNGIRVLDVSGSNESEEFENFKELNNSDWKLSGASFARLSDGTILCEGRQ